MKSLLNSIMADYADKCAEYYENDNPQRGGALIGAESKRAKRKLVFTRLSEAARRYKWDMTQTHAYHAAERILGRGVSMDHARAWFATTERTAANKSALEIQEMQAVEEMVRAELESLNDRMEQVRRAIKPKSDESQIYQRKCCSQAPPKREIKEDYVQ